MNELQGIAIAALHDERWVAERSDPSRRHRRTLASARRSQRRAQRQEGDDKVVWRRRPRR